MGRVFEWVVWQGGVESPVCPVSNIHSYLFERTVSRNYQLPLQTSRHIHRHDSKAFTPTTTECDHAIIDIGIATNDCNHVISDISIATNNCNHVLRH